MKLLVRKKLVEGLTLGSQDLGHVFGKQHRKPFSTSRASRAIKLQGLVHFDVWALAKIPYSSGTKYFLKFIDNLFRKTFCYFLKK
jgi:DNA-binding transcriptional regulator YbjK